MEKLVVYESLERFNKFANREFFAIFRAYTKKNFVKYSKYRIVQIRVRGHKEYLEFFIKDVFVKTDILGKKYIGILIK